jgi:hypothetical protein
MAMPLWVVKIIKKTFPGLFTVAKLTKAPGIGRAIEYALFEGDDIMYLPRDRVVRIGRAVEGEGDMVLPSQVVEHFIDAATHHWIMDTCICREANGCKDYPIGLGCLFMGDAAMRINPGLGRPVSRQEARDHVSRCREAGLVHLIGRNKLDTVWLGVGPGERLLTVCNCCPCCCLWRAIPHLRKDISGKITRMPGVRVEVSGDCVGCGECAEPEVCFVRAVSMEDGLARISDECRGCGRCVTVCPNHAIELHVDDDGFVTRAIERISARVDVS